MAKIGIPHRIRRGSRRPPRWLAVGLPLTLLTLLVACAPESPEGGLPTHPSERFSVTLAWDAPSTDAMGNALEDLAGFRIYHSPVMPPDGPEGTRIEVGGATEYTVQDLAAGSYWFAVTAVDASGNESDLSEALRVEVGAP